MSGRLENLVEAGSRGGDWDRARVCPGRVRDLAACVSDEPAPLIRPNTDLEWRSAAGLPTSCCHDRIELKVQEFIGSGRRDHE